MGKQTLKVFAKYGLKKGEEIAVEQHGAALEETQWQSLTDTVQSVLISRTWVKSIRRSADGRDHYATLARVPSIEEFRHFIEQLKAATSFLSFKIKVLSMVKGTKPKKQKPKKPPQRTKAEMVGRGIDGLIEDIENGADPVYANRGLRAIIEAVEGKKLLRLAKAVKRVLDK